MRKIKLLFLIILSFLVSGCSIEYNLLVNDKREVEETVNVGRMNAAIMEVNTDISSYLNEQISSYKQVDMFKRYEFNKHVGKTRSFVSLKRNYPSLNDYSYSPIFRNIFEGVSIVANEKYVVFNTVGKYYYKNVYGDEEEIEPDSFVDDISIKIKFFNKVIDSNADNVNNKSNILEWKLLPQDTSKSIYFKISNEKRYDIIIIDFLEKNKLPIIGISVLLISILCICIYIYRMMKKSNVL